MDLIDTVENLQHLVPADQLINEIIKENFDEFSGQSQTKKIIKRLIQLSNFLTKLFIAR